MHLMHLIWLAGHIIGFFKGPSIVVITTMSVLGLILIFVFFKVFEKDLFNESDE
jgi:hypothetical protein